MAFSFTLVNAGDLFPFAISFCLVPIIIAGYFYGMAWAYLVSVILTAFCIGLTKLGLEFVPMLMSAVSFNIAPLVVLRFNRLLKDHREECKGRLILAENEYRHLLEEDSRIKEFNSQLERDVLDMARLYEITKAMSGSMEFPGIFSVLKNILGRMFRFSSAKLILVQKNPDKETPDIQHIYRIDPLRQQQLFDDKKLIKLAAGSASFLENNKEHPDDAHQQENIVEPAQSDVALVEAYSKEKRKPNPAAFWLFFQDTPMGVLSVEGIQEDQIDKFLIIASQFGMELQRIRLYEMVQQLAIMDGLTGMFVRRYLLERCQDELRRAIKHKLNLACLVVDIDFFKYCNDKYGHLVGDAVLKQLAVIIKENIREVDFAGRFGGEEFCIALPDTTTDGAIHVADRLRASVEQHVFKAYDESIKITVSVGVSVFPDDASDLNQLIDCADQAMYKAKAEGRNKVCTWK